MRFARSFKGQGFRKARRLFSTMTCAALPATTLEHAQASKLLPFSLSRQQLERKETSRGRTVLHCNIATHRCNGPTGTTTSAVARTGAHLSGCLEGVQDAELLGSLRERLAPCRRKAVDHTKPLTTQKTEGLAQILKVDTWFPVSCSVVCRRLGLYQHVNINKLDHPYVEQV